MSEVLKKVTPNIINSYIEKNLDDFYAQSSQYPNFKSQIEDKICWILARNANWPDGIFRVNFENLDLKKEINRVKKLIRKGKAPNGWTVGPLTKPNCLGSLLEDYGFSNAFQQAGMAIELKELEKIETIQNNLIIEKVKNEESLIQWSNVVSQGFGLKVDLNLLKFLYLQKEPHFYLGKYEGTPVSSLLLYLSSGVAGIHAVSTLPEYRNKGFGFSMSRNALIDALNMGYYVGVLQASSLGEKVYRKLGFKKYCDIVTYVLENK